VRRCVLSLCSTVFIFQLFASPVPVNGPLRPQEIVSVQRGRSCLFRVTAGSREARILFLLCDLVNTTQTTLLGTAAFSLKFPEDGGSSIAFKTLQLKEILGIVVAELEATIKLSPIEPALFPHRSAVLGTAQWSPEAAHEPTSIKEGRDHGLKENRTLPAEENILILQSKATDPVMTYPVMPVATTQDIGITARPTPVDAGTQHGETIARMKEMGSTHDKDVQPSAAQQTHQAFKPEVFWEPEDDFSAEQPPPFFFTHSNTNQEVIDAELLPPGSNLGPPPLVVLPATVALSAATVEPEELSASGAASEPVLVPSLSPRLIPRVSKGSRDVSPDSVLPPMRSEELLRHVQTSAGGYMQTKAQLLREAATQRQIFSKRMHFSKH